MGEELIVTKERTDFAPQSLAYPAEDACPAASGETAGCTDRGGC
jgi:hypothetical protein